MNMTIENARFSGADETVILATIGGVETSVPVDDENRFYREIQDQAIPIAPYAPPPIVAADVKREARRRIVAEIPDWKQRNLLARQVELMARLVDTTAFSPAEQAEWDAAQAWWTRVKDLRAASAAMEDAPPDDFKDNARWPAAV